MQTLLAILVLLIAFVLHAAQASTNLLAIYLLDRPAAQPWPNLDAAHLKDLKPVSPPALADSDFVAFNLTNHTFVVTGAAAKRLSLQIWSLAKKDAPGWGGQVPIVYRTGDFALIPVPAPFVLEACGERIYAGAFYTGFSSSGFSGPVIMGEREFIKMKQPKGATFSFSIGLGYPGALPGTPDPRGDRRIASAVQRLVANRH